MNHPSTSANQALAELLRAHDVPVQELEGCLSMGQQGPLILGRFFTTRNEPGSCTAGLEVSMEPWNGRMLTESFAGLGATVEEAQRDALGNFARASLHVLLSAFLGTAHEHVTFETWRVGGIDRKVILGDVVARGPGEAPGPHEPWLESLKQGITSLPLATGIHWVRVFYAQAKGERMSLEVLLDNEPWVELTEKLASAAWPVAPEFLSRRLFLVLQGGMDISRVVTAWFATPADEDLTRVIQQQGVTRLEAEKIQAYLPLAFGEPVLRSMGLATNDTAEFTANAPTVERSLSLSEDPLWRDAVALAEQVRRGNTSLSKEQMVQLASSGAPMRVLNDLMSKGSKPDGVRFTPTLFLLSPEAMAEWPDTAPERP
jgi:hypothetical protein